MPHEQANNPGGDIRECFEKHRDATSEMLRETNVTDPVARLTMIVQAGFAGIEDALVHVAAQVEMLRSDLKGLQDDASRR
jgi:hypothetical protein